VGPHAERRKKLYREPNGISLQGTAQFVAKKETRGLKGSL